MSNQECLSFPSILARGKQLSLFQTAYETILNQKDAAAPNEVLVFYGVGGVGKSHLLCGIRETLKKIPAGTKPIILHLDFASEDNSQELPVLRSLRNQLVEQGFHFELFDLALYVYADKTKQRFKEVNQSTIVERLSQNDFGQFTKFLTKTAIALPVSGFIVKGADAANELINFLSKELRMRSAGVDWDKISVDKLREQFGTFFVKDLQNNSATNDRPIIAFIDNFESVSAEEGNNAPIWLLGKNARKTGLINQFPKSLWIISGRNKLESPETANVRIAQSELTALNLEETTEFLSRDGIDDIAFCEKLFGLTKGLPYLLAACINRYKELQASGRAYDINEYGQDASRLFEKIFGEMSIEREENLYILSSLQSWTEESLRGIAKNIQGFHWPVYERMKGKFPVQQTSAGHYLVQPAYNEVTQSQPWLSPVIKEMVFKAAIRYYQEQLQKDPFYTAEHASWLNETGLALLRRLCSFYSKLLDLHKNNWEERGDFVDEEDLERMQKDAVLLSKNWKTSDALALMEKILEARKQLLGDGTEAVIDSTIAIGVCYSVLKHHEIAIENLSNAIEMGEKVLGAKHEKVLEAKLSLGVTKSASKKQEEAIPLLEELCTIRTEQLAMETDEEKRNTLLFAKTKAQNSLAIAFHQIGNHKKARDLFYEVLDTRKNKLATPANNRDILSVMNFLASNLTALGQFDKAKAFIDEGLQICGNDVVMRRNKINFLKSLANMYQKTNCVNLEISTREEIITLTKELGGDTSWEEKKLQALKA